MLDLTDSFKRQAPTVEKFKNWLALGSSGSMKEIVDRPSHIPVRDHMDLNYYSFSDIVNHWNVLDVDRSILTHACVNMEVEGYGPSGNWVGCKNYCAFGMKHITEYVGYLMSLIMVGGDFSNRGSILHDNLYYSSQRRDSKFVKNRVLSPAYSNCNGKEWYRDHKDSIQGLLRKGTCYTFVIHERDVSIFDSGYSETVRADWDVTTRRLNHLLRLKNVLAFSYHREISYSSIEHGTLHPHTHVMLWVKGKYSHDRIRESLKLDREIGFSSHKWTKGSLSKLEGYYRYLNGVYSPEKVYKREWTPETARTVNKNLREMIWATLEIFSGVRKIGSGNIPTNISRLQKEEKRYKIKETKSAPKEPEHDEQRISNGNTLHTTGEQDIKRGEPGNTLRAPGESLWTEGIGESFKRVTTLKHPNRGEPQLQNGIQECHAGEWG